MILIIMRHGEAGDFSSPDHLRQLTPRGKRQCQSVGQMLGEKLPKLLEKYTEPSNNANNTGLDITLVSPFLRTQQSFRAVASGIKSANIVTIDSITPAGNAQQSADLIHGYATDSSAPRSMMVVTHMPLVSLLADKICPEFNARIFETADTLIIDYNISTGRGEQIEFYHSER
jgi:phosphohistidine phosphatase